MIASRSFYASAAAMTLIAVLAAALSTTPPARAQEQLPWGQSERPRVVQPGEQSQGSGNSGGYGARDTVAQAPYSQE